MNEQLAVTDDREQSVVEFWRKGHVSFGTVVIYLLWVWRFRSYCSNHKLIENEQLTISGAQGFMQYYAGPRLKGRRSAQSSRDSARNALHAWACALRATGTSLPPWRDKQERSPLPPLIDEYCQYRQAHNGVSERTLVRDIETACEFLKHLRDGKRRVEQSTLSDVDDFSRRLAMRVSKRTVADTCSSLRAFLRFLHMTGRLPADLGSGVIAPRYRTDEHPPRTLPWIDVQKILRSISQSEPPGKRDFAILLLLAAYGVGAAEVLALRLGDLYWRAGIVTFRRPKTHVSIELPLLPAIAKALTAYLQSERPPARRISSVFLRKSMPYEPITSGAIRHRIRYYARMAGISARVIGAHAFRHYATSRTMPRPLATT